MPAPASDPRFRKLRRSMWWAAGACGVALCLLAGLAIYFE